MNCLTLPILCTSTYKDISEPASTSTSGKTKMISLSWNEPPSVLRNRNLQGIIHFFLPNYGQTACLKEVNISGPDIGKFPNWIFLMALQRNEYVNKQKYLCSDFSWLDSRR